MAGKARNYEGQEIDVQYDVKRCIHAKECVNRLSAVFDVDKRPWIQPDNTPTTDALAETIQHCPTGALHFSRKDGGAQEQTPEDNTIRIVPDGPLYVRGDVAIINSSGEMIIEDVRVALCRCGASNNKPFCDNTHKDIHFKDTGTPDEHPNSDPNATGESRLHVETAKNGPLLLSGEIEIIGADGQSVFLGTATALCRCGHSSNKPFCDGTHRTVGFEGD
ncbi:MAG: CDGSH iron-sulfur domain-containing protein [Aggregatilineales bacterium]